MSQSQPVSQERLPFGCAVLFLLLILITVYGLAMIPSSLVLYVTPGVVEATLGRAMCPGDSRPTLIIREISRNGRSPSTYTTLQCRDRGRLVAEYEHVAWIWSALWVPPLWLAGYLLIQRGKRLQAARQAAGLPGLQPAAGPPLAEGGPAAPPPAQRSDIAGRLVALDDLRERGLISDDEYAAKRAEILASL